MGLVIKVLKPIQKTDANNEDALHIYTLDFSPIEHLSKFDEDYYECEEIEAPRFHWPYGTYGEFRRKVCSMALVVAIENVWEDVEKYINAPFIEFINFADNEGCFDYAVAEKLYKDFLDLLNEAESCLKGPILHMYKTYMEILRIAAENKAVVYYL